MATGSPSGRLREEQSCLARRREGVPDVAIRALGPDEEAGPVRGLAIDPVELREPGPIAVDHDDPARAGLVHVLTPLLAQVAPQGGFVGAQVDDAGGRRLDGRGDAPAGGTEGTPQAPIGVVRPVRLDLRVDAQVAHPAGDGPQSRAAGIGEGGDRRRRPFPGHRTARGIGEGPRHRLRPADEDLRADAAAHGATRAAQAARAGLAGLAGGIGATGPGRGAHRIGGAGRHDPVRRPAVDGLHASPGGLLEVRPGVAHGHERIPGRGAGQLRHDRRGRGNTSTMTPTIVGSSGIRNTSETPA